MYKANVYSCLLVKDREVSYGKINTQLDVVAILQRMHVNQMPEEHVYLFCTDNQGNISGVHEISHGTVNASLVSPRDVYKRALLNNANRIILAHNHPAGSVEPSSEDMSITRKIKDAGKVLDVELLDHIIVSDADYFSFAERGML